MDCFLWPRLFLAILPAFLGSWLSLRRDLVLACSLPRALLLGDRSFDHDNDTEREDGIHRMDAHIVANEDR
ncbi:MAG: hypothetical protein M0008_13980, partial [Actinomycetota bacterium]|nr:hypothetical protein [Actinomycetota bacterium]